MIRFLRCTAHNTHSERHNNPHKQLTLNFQRTCRHNPDLSSRFAIRISPHRTSNAFVGPSCAFLQASRRVGSTPFSAPPTTILPVDRRISLSSVTDALFPRDPYWIEYVTSDHRVASSSPAGFMVRNSTESMTYEAILYPLKLWKAHFP
jgi:hypothetical protein